MKAEGWIRRLVAPEYGGPMKRSLVEALARRHGGSKTTVDGMIRRRELVKFGSKRGTTWGLPKARKRRPA